MDRISTSTSQSVLREEIIRLKELRDFSLQGQVNMEYAEYGLQECRRQFPLGGINKTATMDNVKNLPQEDQTDFFVLLHDVHRYSEVLTKFQSPIGLTPDEISEKAYLERPGTLSGAGCLGLAHLTRNMIIAKYGVKVEVVSVLQHQFLVIGREPDSDRANIDTWGNDAVICDPWAEKFYLASSFREMQKTTDDIPFVKFDVIVRDRKLYVNAGVRPGSSHYLTGDPVIVFPL